MNNELDENMLGFPVCQQKNKMKSVSLPKCNKNKLNIVTRDKGNNPNYCYINHGKFYEKRSISRICPRLFPKFMQEYKSDTWPVCKRRKKIDPNKCDQDYAHKRADHCLLIEKGWYSYNEYKSICPKGSTHVGLYYENKPLCKKRLALKIKKNKCAKKDGFQYENFCIWPESDYFKARKIK